MSIIWTLKKLVDPISHRQEAAMRRRDREIPRHSLAGDPPDPGAQKAALPHLCQACGHRALGPGFCPVCLADTMRPLTEEAP